ncbi:hypothetical protein DFJ74DRAFT_659998 [Hyaloraphidium curvatum]|nr:hypothetical protein DFJ74DRAFT_659998 [Hyaloraphidium curvatum]
MVTSSREGVEGFLQAIGATGSLEKVRLKVKRYSDPDVRKRDPQSDPFLPLLRHIDGLSSFEEINLDDCEVGWRRPVPGSSAWALSFHSLPRAGSCLRRITVHEKRRKIWESVRLRSIPEVEYFCDADAEPGSADALRRICDCFPGMRNLLISSPDTSALAGFDFGELELLDLFGSNLNLQPRHFHQVMSALERSGTRLKIKPHWEGLVNDIEDPFEAYEEAQRWRMEESFWLGLANVEIERYGEWAKLFNALEDEIAELEEMF